MDPNANLKEQLELASRLVKAVNPRPNDVHRLAELVLAMDEWLRCGGFPPDEWPVVAISLLQKIRES